MEYYSVMRKKEIPTQLDPPGRKLTNSQKKDTLHAGE